MIRKKKKNNKNAPIASLSAIAKKYSIRISTPYGYYPEDTDDIIEKLENNISQATSELSRLEKNYDNLNKEYKSLKAEFERQSFELLKLDFNNSSETQDYDRLDQLASISKEVGKISEPINKEVEKENIDIVESPISSDNSDYSLDNLISTENHYINPEPVKPEVSTSSITEAIDADGTLDILENIDGGN